MGANLPDRRWAQVKDLFEMAMDCDISERDSLLSLRCGDDEELRREVQSLLSAHDSTGGFLEEPYFDLKSLRELPEAVPGPQAGDRIGAYRVESLLGRGGMGAVYLATRADEEFRKRVAIKLIRLGAEDSHAVKRFRNERQILASLEHPFVARLLDGATTPEGMPYFVMEYVEGMPLNQFCVAHELSERQRIELFLKVCSAVDYAHRRSVIHRDLKPTNILVQADGTPKLLDFGIAKLVGPARMEWGVETTLTSVQALTPAYASPEQLQGQDATVRSDIYSLGVILYELLTGSRFNLAVLKGADEKAQRPTTTSTPALTAGIRTILSTATCWEPDGRYASVQALVADLESFLAGTPIAAHAAQDDASQPLPGSIAVLPFDLPEGDTTAHAYLGVGITDALISRLSRVGRIMVRPTSAVLKYAQSRDAVRAGKELQVRYVLEGRVRTLGQQVRVSVQLVSVDTQSPVWAATIDERADDILKLEDSISEQVAHALIPQLTGEEQESLRNRGTRNAKAHDLYLKGRWHWSRSSERPEELAQSLVCFMEAIAEDPQYAKAHAGVADYYISLGMWGGLPPAESFAAAKEAAAMALQIDSSLAEAHAGLAFALWALDGAVEEAEQHFHLAITRDPESPNAHYLFGLFYAGRQRLELGAAYLERATKLAPDSPSLVCALAFCFYSLRQFDRAINLLQSCQRHTFPSGVISELLARCHLQAGEPGKALAEARKAVQLSERSASSMAILAQVEAANGNRKTALALADELERLAAERYTSKYLRAVAQCAIGNTNRCLQLLREGIAERDWRTHWLSIAPDWDIVRENEQFRELMQTSAKDVAVAATAPSKPETRLSPIHLGRKFVPIGLAAGAVLFLIAIAFALRTWVYQPNPFRDVQITKVTSNGTAIAAAVSPDGKLIAYSTKERSGITVRVRPNNSSRSQLLTISALNELNALSFTADGKYISFVTYSSSQPGQRFLNLVPAKGGPVEQLGTFGGPVSLSQDGKRVAFLVSNDAKAQSELWVAQRNGTGRRLVTKLAYPRRFTWPTSPAWSHDGKKVACGVEGSDEKGFAITILVSDIETGRQVYLRSPRWQWTEQLAWTENDNGLAVVGQEQDSSFQQLWYVKYPGGEPTRIANDLNDYSTVSVSSNNHQLVSVQTQTLSNIFLLRDSRSSAPRQITTGSGRYFDLSWSASGKILFASDATGSADLWMMNTDGSEDRQLTQYGGRSYAPSGSPDGKWIAFHSNRNGNWNIWRVDAEGQNAVQLTSGLEDSNWPQFTPDSNWIVYHHTQANGLWNLWKVPTLGGRPVQLTKALTTHPAVSPKDGSIACWYSTTVDEPDWKLAIIPAEGGEPVRLFDIASTVVPDSNIRWTSDGQGITFLDGRGGASNIWIQGMDGSPARPLTSFTSGQIFSFDWFRDGTLAFSRGMSLSDAVLIRPRSPR